MTTANGSRALRVFQWPGLGFVLGEPDDDDDDDVDDVAATAVDVAVDEEDEEDGGFWGSKKAFLSRTTRWTTSLSPVRRKMCERVWVEESVLVYVWMRG